MVVHDFVPVQNPNRIGAGDAFDGDADDPIVGAQKSRIGVIEERIVDRRDAVAGRAAAMNVGGGDERAFEIEAVFALARVGLGKRERAQRRQNFRPHFPIVI